MPRSDIPYLEYRYRYRLSDGTEKVFDIRLDRKTLAVVPNGSEARPDWTKLGFRKCTNCPLNESEQPHCPIAVSLVEPVEFFKKAVSHDEVEVEIESEQRTYRKRTPVQYALGSMIGIYMVSSGCPVMDKLRPMVRLHLPFASSEETTYRTISMYLLAQYLKRRRGEAPDWELKDLRKINEEISIVNECFKKRIAATQLKDASLNAVVHLDLFARMTNMLLLNEDLDKIAGWFHPYLSGGADKKG